MFRALTQHIALVLTVVLIVPPLSFAIAPPQEAHAGDSPASGVAACAVTYVIVAAAGFIGAVAGYANATAVPTSETNAWDEGVKWTNASAAVNEVLKECILDPIMWYLKQEIITTLTEEVLDWMNDGFLGSSPIFVQDPLGFFTQISDRAVEFFLYETDLNQSICEPFRKTVIDTAYHDYMTPPYKASGTAKGASRGPATCAHAESGLDWDTFVENGEFNAPGQGFSTYFAMLQDSNNPVGAFFEVNSQMAVRAGNAVGVEAELLAYGDGFHSDVCDFDKSVPGADGVCTPGKFIVGQLEDWTGGMLAQLEQADEFSEIVDAGMARLTSSILENHLWDFSEVQGYWDNAKAAVGTAASDPNAASQNNSTDWLGSDVWTDPENPDAQQGTTQTP